MCSQDERKEIVTIHGAKDAEVSDAQAVDCYWPCCAGLLYRVRLHRVIAPPLPGHCWLRHNLHPRGEPGVNIAVHTLQKQLGGWATSRHSLIEAKK